MGKVLKILNIIVKVLTSVVLTLVALVCLLMAYIMFAPDDFPKPFRLVYQYPVDQPSYMPLGYLPPNTVPTPEVTPIPDSPQEVKAGEGVMIDMSTKIINLSDPSGRKYIRLTVVLEFQPEAATEEVKSGEGAATDPNAAFKAKVEARMPLMDDVVITLLSTKSYEDLYTADGKELLRQEIQDAINERIPEFHVISVYFTEFVVQ